MVGGEALLVRLSRCGAFGDWLSGGYAVVSVRCTFLREGWCAPILVAELTSIGRWYVPIVVAMRTSIGQLADQYRSLSRVKQYGRVNLYDSWGKKTVKAQDTRARDYYVLRHSLRCLRPSGDE